MCQWRWRLLKNQHLEMASFEQTQEILKLTRMLYAMISIFCFSCSIVIVDMLNTFKKNYNYLKGKHY